MVKMVFESDDTPDVVWDKVNKMLNKPDSDIELQDAIWELFRHDKYGRPVEVDPTTKELNGAK